MTQRKHKGDLFSVKRKREKIGTKRKAKKYGGKKENNNNKIIKKPDHLSSIDAHPFTYKTLTVGQVLLGCISNVKEYELIVSLPHKLVGSVTLAHISRPYTALLSKMKDGADEDEDEEVLALKELYQIGQYVVASVVSIEMVNNMTKVNLTLMPNEVNFGITASSLEVGLVLPCAVCSVEDKGYTIDTGIAGIKGAFMKKEDTHKSMRLGVGSVVRCVITKISGPEDSLNLTLSSNPKAVNSAALSLTDATNVSLLLPGTAVKTTISKVDSDAIILMLADLDGIVSPIHLAKPFDTVKEYSVGDEVLARVLYVTPLSKVVHFTLQKGVCNTKSIVNPLKEIHIGDIMRGVEIYKTSSSGIYVKLNSERRGFCSGNYISDKSQVLRHITRDYRVGKKITCRITKYNYLDKLFIVSLQQSVLQQQFMSYSELEAGQLVEGVVSGYSDVGAAEVTLSKTVNGHVAPLHLPKKRPAIGEQVTARVLKVNPERQHLLLTLKSKLVNAKESVLTEYTDTAVNKLTVGYVVKVMPSGLLVGMFNDVKGFVPRSQCPKLEDQDLGDTFREGQVVRCRVLKVCLETQRITLSLFLLAGDKPETPHKTTSVTPDIEMRSRVECVVDKVEENVVQMKILPHHTEAIIPVHHLSDYTTKCELMKEVIREKDIIQNAIVFSKLNRTITLTLKPSVTFWIDQTPSDTLNNEELVSGQSYPASVCDVKSYGAFVTIPSGSKGSTALVHIKNLVLPSKQKNGKEWEVGIGQSLYVSFKDRDDKGRPILTSSPKDNVNNATQSSLQLLYSFLKTEESLTQGLLMRGKGGPKAKLARYCLGDKVAAVVVEVSPTQVQLKVKKNGIRGIVPSGHHCDKSVLQVGQKVKACVLYVNHEEEMLDLSLKPNVLSNLHTDSEAAPTGDTVHVGMKVKCEVVLCKPVFSMLIMKSKCKGRVVYVPTVMHLNMVGSGNHSSVGSKCWVVVKHIEGPLVLGVLHCHDKEEKIDLASTLPKIMYSPRSEEEEENEEDDEEKEEEGMKVEDSLRSDNDTKSVFEKETKEEKEKASKKRQLENNNKVSKSNKKSKKAEVNPSNSKEDLHTDEGVSLQESTKISTACKEDNMDDDEADEDEEKYTSSKPCLSLDSGFVWDVPSSHDIQDNLSDDSEEENEELTKKKLKKTVKRSGKDIDKEEQRLHQIELARLDDARTPHTAAEFEALLQNTPNSSPVWIQFISFHLQSAEIDKAKAVARRALQVIDPQEEEERLNVWTVLLRLEVLYGSEESASEAYKEALITADPLKIHLAMAMVYAENNKLKDAEKIYFHLSKKFSQELNVWVKCGVFFYTHSMVKEGRHYLDRALHSLDKKEHVELINRFGQLEFRFGEMERGRTMFESLLSTYWKRTDIWGVYVDLLVKAKDIVGARHVLERMTTLKLRVRKMRFVFKKFLEFEKEHGNSENVETVKRRVEDFVAATLK